MGVLGLPTDQYMALDTDGTLAYWIDTPHTTAKVISGAYMTPFFDMNTATSVGISVASGETHTNFLFPEPRTITAFSCKISAALDSVRISTDTVTGVDGTWTTAINTAGLAEWINCSQQKLMSPTSVTWTNIKGVELKASSNITIFDIAFWGYYTPLGLEYYHPTLNQRMQGINLDFGDVGQGTILTKDFRIKNNYSMTANNVTVSSPATPVVGLIRNDLEFSDGGAYAASVIVPSIAPGALSPVISMRRSVSPTATINTIGGARVTAIAQSWT